MNKGLSKAFISEFKSFFSSTQINIKLVKNLIFTDFDTFERKLMKSVIECFKSDTNIVLRNLDAYFYTK